MNVAEINKFCENTLISNLGIQITEIKNNIIIGKMPVDNRTKQPWGLLHGGAMMAFAETLGSVGSYMLIDREKYDVVGAEIHGSYLKNTKCNEVIGYCTLIKAGRHLHRWEVKIFDTNNELMAIAILTNMVIQKFS